MDCLEIKLKIWPKAVWTATAAVSALQYEVPLGASPSHYSGMLQHHSRTRSRALPIEDLNVFCLSSSAGFMRLACTSRNMSLVTRQRMSNGLLGVAILGGIASFILGLLLLIAGTALVGHDAAGRSSNVMMKDLAFVSVCPVARLPFRVHNS